MDMRVMLLITTHLSKIHLDIMEHCWPHILKNVSLIRTSDIVVYTDKTPPDSFTTLFPNATVKIHEIWDIKKALFKQ